MLTSYQNNHVFMPISPVRKIFDIEYLMPSKKEHVLPNLNNLYNVDLAFKSKDTQYSTHGIHTYVAAINPPLVKTLINTYIPEGENILDPYCGGGGVLVESVLNNRSCAGGDINPLAIIISKAKTTYIPKQKVLEAGLAIYNLAQKNISKIHVSNLDKQINFWFKEKNLIELLSLSNAVKKLINRDSILLPLFQTILSGTTRDVMLTYRGEVRLRKLRTEDLEKFNPNTFSIFKKRLDTAAIRVDQLPQNIKCDVDLRDIRNLPFKKEQFYGIICSPPYADDKNGVGYFQFSKNMLSFLGYNTNDLKKCRELFHGMSKDKKTAPKSDSLSLSLSNVAKNDKKKYEEGVAFYADYADGLKEMARVTKKWIIIVVGNRVLARTQFDNAAITVEIFKNLGINLEDHYTRELKKKRIPNLGSDGGGINLEHILVFKK